MIYNYIRLPRDIQWNPFSKRGRNRSDQVPIDEQSPFGRISQKFRILKAGVMAQEWGGKAQKLSVQASPQLHSEFGANLSYKRPLKELSQMVVEFKGWREGRAEGAEHPRLPGGPHCFQPWPTTDQPQNGLIKVNSISPASWCLLDILKLMNNKKIFVWFHFPEKLGNVRICVSFLFLFLFLDRKPGLASHLTM